MSGDTVTHSRVARFIHRVPLLVVVAWLALTVVVNVVVPQLEEVGKAHSVSLAAKDAQSYQAIKKQGANFEQFDSDSMVMVLLEGDEPLGDQARTYYHGLVEKLRANTEHVSTCRTSGATGSPPVAPRVWTTRPPMCS